VVELDIDHRREGQRDHQVDAGDQQQKEAQTDHKLNKGNDEQQREVELEGVVEVEGIEAVGIWLPYNVATCNEKPKVKRPHEKLHSGEGHP